MGWRVRIAHGGLSWPFHELATSPPYNLRVQPQGPDKHWSSLACGRPVLVGKQANCLPALIGLDWLPFTNSQSRPSSSSPSPQFLSLHFSFADGRPIDVLRTMVSGSVEFASLLNLFNSYSIHEMSDCPQQGCYRISNECTSVKPAPTIS